MNNNAIEAYKYYKEMYAPFIIFFRINNTYHAYFEDAQTISSILKIPIDGECVAIPSEQILDVMGSLSSHGKQAKMISYRDDLGHHTLPDVSLLKAEKEADI